MIRNTVVFCLLLATSLSAENIIKNGNFESGMDSWSCWNKEMNGKYVKVTDSRGVDGKNSLMFTGDPAYPHNKMLNCNQIKLPLRANASYILQLRYLNQNPVKNPAKRLQVAILERGARGKVLKRHSFNLPQSVKASGKWAKFSHSFTSSKEKVIYYQFLIFARNLGKDEKLYIDNISVKPYDPIQEKAAVKAYLNKLRIQAKQYRRVTPKTYVFARSQLKYGMGRNYLHWWNDRPLFNQRSMRGKPGFVYRVKPESWMTDVRIAKLYGMDGLGMLTTNSGQTNNYLEADRILGEQKVKNFLLLPEFHNGAKLALCEQVIERAVKSQHTFRINGKAVIGSYVATAWTPQQWKGFIEKMRKKYGDTFLFIADLRHLNSVSKVQNNELSIEEIQAEEQLVRNYLDVCDGIMFAGANHVKLYQSGNGYGDSINVAYLRDYLTPLFKSVLSEPKYRNKILGLSAAVAYINRRSGACKRQDGTKTLRRTFETAINAKPDFIESPEWNEFNENTCFQPTVSRSLASQRIIRYFIRKANGLQTRPNPGDDTSIPNLIISYRRTISLGEKLKLELLNVPDNDSDAEYSVQLILKDSRGETVKSFPRETFVVGKMHDINYSLASENFADVQSLYPCLKIVNTKGKTIDFDQGLLPVRLTPNANTDFLEVNQPLRDVCQPEKFSLKAKVLKNKSVYFESYFASKEKIKSVELLESGEEVFALDPKDEFKRDKYTLFRITISSAHATRLRGKLFISGVSSYFCRSADNDNMGLSNTDDSDLNLTPQKDGIKLNLYACISPRFVYLNIPTAEVNKAVFELKSNHGAFKVSAKSIIDNGVWGKSLPKQFFIRFDRFRKLPDLPFDLNTRNVAFEYQIKPQSPYPVYFVRVVTESGKIFRSKPVVPFKYNKNRVAFNIFSETKGKPIKIQFPADAIPVLKYRFDPKFGAVTIPDAYPAWAGELGGGLLYGEPFARRSAYPKDAVNAAPKYIKLVDGWGLEFDGKGNYLTFPHETLPRNSFTIDFDIKPADASSMVLLRTYFKKTRFFALTISKGMLCAAYIPQNSKVQRFNTELAVVPKTWSHIRIKNELDKIIFTVNGKSQSFPLNGRPAYYSTLAFGGPSKLGAGVSKGTGLFKGILKKMEITHK